MNFGEQQRAKRRLQQLSNEVEERLRDFDAGRLSAKAVGSFVTAAETEARNLRAGLKAARRGAAFHVGPGDVADGGSPSPNGFRSPSPLNLTTAQAKSLYQAAKSGMNGFSIEIGTKNAGAQSAFLNSVTTKDASPVVEDGLNLPAIMAPGVAMGLPYEPTRLSAYFPGAQMPGPSAEWLQHTGNTTEAGGVAENAAKPYLGPTVVSKTAVPQKIAGIVSASLEALQDYEDFAAWLPVELTRSVINAESNFIINGNATGGPTSTFDGLLATSGTLTRAVDTGGSEKPLDTLNEAFVDLRTGDAFADPDLVVISPKTWGALRREKDAQGRYLLDLLAGPAGLSWDGSPDAVFTRRLDENGVQPQGQSGARGGIWGVPVVESTQVADGTAIVLSVKSGAAFFWQRLGMFLQFNLGFTDGDWSHNRYSWRCEERVALSVPRPAAINVVTGLPGGA